MGINIPPSRNWQSGNQPGRLSITTVSIITITSMAVVHEEEPGRGGGEWTGSGEQKRVALPCVGRGGVDVKRVAGAYR